MRVDLSRSIRPPVLSSMQGMRISFFTGLLAICLSSSCMSAQVAHGAVQHQTFTTQVVLGLPENADDFYIYTPPGYDAKGSTRYPVLYLLHGWSQTSNSWDTTGHARQTLDELIGSGRARPMIVVMPTGYGDMRFLRDGFGVWQDPTAIDHNTGLFQESLLKEIIPRVESEYRVSAKREDRAIAGLSMGGLESLVIGLNNTGKFAWIGGFSSAVHAVQPSTLSHLDPGTADLRLLWMSCGTSDGLLEPNQRLEQALEVAGLKVTAVETPGAHTWPVWRDDLTRFLPLLFQPQ